MKIPLSLSERDTRGVTVNVTVRGVSRGSRVRVDFLFVTSSSTRELAILAHKRRELPSYSFGRANNNGCSFSFAEKPKAALDLDTPERPGNEKHFSLSHVLASHIVQYFSNLIPPYGRIDNALFVKQWFSPVFPLSISAGNIFRAASGMRAVLA